MVFDSAIHNRTGHYAAKPPAGQQAYRSNPYSAFGSAATQSPDSLQNPPKTTGCDAVQNDYAQDFLIAKTALTFPILSY